MDVFIKLKRSKDLAGLTVTPNTTLMNDKTSPLIGAAPVTIILTLPPSNILPKQERKISRIE